MSYITTALFFIISNLFFIDERSISMNDIANVRLKWLVTIILPLCILFIPLSELYTQSLRIFFIVTVFAILLVVFDLVDSLVAAMVLFMGYSVTGIAEASVVFSAWSNDVAWMIIGSLVFCAALEKTGIMNRLAYQLISKLGGSYSKMLWAIYFAALVISFLTSVTGFPLFATIVFGICHGMGYKMGSREANGVVFAAMTGAVAPFAWLYNPINAGVGASVINMFDSSLTITWISYLQTAAPWLVFDMIWMILITKVFFKPENNQISEEYFQQELSKLGPMSNAEKKALVLTVLVVAYLIGSSFLGWKTAYGFSILAWAVYLPGIRLANGETLKKVNFGIVFFTVACISIGTVGNAVGVGALITGIVSPMLQGLSDVAYIFGVWVISTISNLLLTPVAVTTALGVPMMQIGVDLGISPVATLFTMIMNTSNVFMPHENTAYLLYFALGLFSMKDFIKYNSIRMGLHLIFMMAVIVPYWYFIGIL